MTPEHPSSAGPAITRGTCAAIAGLVAVVAALVRVVGLGGRDLRLDEAFTAWVGGQRIIDIPGILAAADTHPPLHYLLVAAVPGAATSEVVLRLISVVAGAATAGLASWATCRALRSAGRRVVVSASLAAGLLVALSPLLVMAGRDGRMYALVSLLVLATLWLANEGRASPRPTPWLAAAAVAGALATYTHAAALPAVGGLLLGAVVVEHDPAWRRRWVWTGLGIGVLWLPWLPSLSTQLGHSSRNLGWLPAPSIQRATADVATLASRGPSLAAAACVLGVTCIAAVLAWRRTPDVRPWTAMAGAAAAGGLLFHLVVSGLVQTLPARNLAVVAAPAAVLVATGVATVRGARWLSAVLVGVVALAGTMRVLPPDPGTEFRAASQALDARADAGDLVAFGASYAEVPVRHYLPSPLAAETVGLPRPFFEDFGWEAPISADDVRDFTALAAEYGRVWLVDVRLQAVDRAGAVRAGLAATHRRAESLEYRGITIERWDRNG